MTAKELCQRFGISVHTLHNWTRRKLIPAPIGRTKGARYGLIHIEAIQAALDLQHNNVSIAQATAYCLETGESLAQYVRRREEAIRTFGIGVA